MYAPAYVDSDACMHAYVFLFVSIWLRLLCVRVVYSLRLLFAMVALLLLVIFAIAPMVGGAGAFGHIVAVALPDMSPLWPLRFAIAWTLVSLLLGSWLFQLWRHHRM